MRFSLPHAIDWSADSLPDQDAFRCRDSKLSYAEIAERSNQLAHLLVELGVGPGDRVGLRLPRCLESPISAYGIMKAGAAFVPIDPFLPGSTVSRLIADCSLRHLITLDVPSGMPENSLSAVVGPEGELPVAERTVPWSSLDAFPKNSPSVRTTELDLAYIMYTSGSTGQPKGIMHTHRSGLSYAELSVATYGVTSQDCIANHSPLHFDMSTFGYFAGPFANATTVLIPEEYTKVPASLSQLMERERITIWYSVPSPLIHLLERGALEKRDLSSLRWVKFGGEPFSRRHLNRLMKLWPSARFSNVYGPAEVNQCSWYHVPTSQDDDVTTPIPIGKIWENSEGIVLDEHGQEVEPGEVGELAVRSATMMRGYWNQPELTDRCMHRAEREGVESRFYRTGDLVRQLDDGDLLFLGRRDRQIKTRGHRVELDDVEAALATLPTVLESAAFPVDDGEGSRLIEAAVLANGDSDLTESKLLDHAKRYLPPYAVPRRIEIHNDFPRTATGKIDRRALAARR